MVIYCKLLRGVQGILTSRFLGRVYCAHSHGLDGCEDVQEDVEEEVQMLRSEAWHQSVF